MDPSLCLWAALQPLLLPCIHLQPPLKQQSFSCWEMGIVLEEEFCSRALHHPPGPGLMVPQNSGASAKAVLLLLVSCRTSNNFSDSRAAALLWYCCAVWSSASLPMQCCRSVAWQLCCSHCRQWALHSSACPV